MNTPSMARLVGGIAVAGALLLTGACGGDSGSKNTGTTKADMSAFQACMKKNGVTMNQGNQGGPGGPGQGQGQPPAGMPSGRPSGMPSAGAAGMPTMSAEMQKAMTACASLRPQAPQGGQGPGAPGGQQQNGN